MNGLIISCNHIVIITTTKLRSTKPKLRFCAVSNPTRGVSEIRNGEDLWQWSGHIFYHIMNKKKKKKKKKNNKIIHKKKKKRKKEKERKNAYGQGTFFVNEKNIIRPGSPGEPKLNQFLSHNSRTTTTVYGLLITLFGTAKLWNTHTRLNRPKSD